MSESDFDWYGPDAATFGDRVAGARQVAGLTQEELAERLGVRLDTITAWGVRTCSRCRSHCASYGVRVTVRPVFDVVH